MDNLSFAAIFAVLAMVGGIFALVIAIKNKKAKSESDNKNQKL